MKIVSLNFETVRATPTIAEFTVRVELDGPARGCEVIGRAIGPKCPGISTVEVAYPMTVAGVSDTAVSLRCAIPEPNLWRPDAPFTYTVAIEVYTETLENVQWPLGAALATVYVAFITLMVAGALLIQRNAQRRWGGAP